MLFPSSYSIITGFSKDIIVEVYRRIHADVIVYIFAHLHTALRKKATR